MQATNMQIRVSIVKSAIFVRIVERKVWCLQFLTKTTLSRLYADRAEDRVFIPSHCTCTWPSVIK